MQMRVIRNQQDLLLMDQQSPTLASLWPEIWRSLDKVYLKGLSITQVELKQLVKTISNLDAKKILIGNQDGVNLRISLIRWLTLSHNAEPLLL